MNDDPFDDDTPLPLDEAARRAFPAGGVEGNTLKRQIRNGKLRGYKPGKAYLTTLRDIKNMLAATSTTAKQERPSTQRSGVVPNGLGLTEQQISEMALQATLDKIRALKKRSR